MPPHSDVIVIVGTALVAAAGESLGVNSSADNTIRLGIIHAAPTLFFVVLWKSASGCFSDSRGGAIASVVVVGVDGWRI